MGKKKKEVPGYLYHDDAFSNFSMVTSDLLMSAPFQDLSHAARSFYIVCATHKQTEYQSTCLYNALKEYYTLMGEEKPEIDLRIEAGQNAKTRLSSKKFVIPQSHLEEYGYSPQYANKLKKELIAAGFIKVFANEKKHSQGLQGATHDFSKRVTIYEFCNDWKKEKTKSS